MTYLGPYDWYVAELGTQSEEVRLRILCSLIPCFQKDQLVNM